MVCYKEIKKGIGTECLREKIVGRILSKLIVRKTFSVMEIVLRDVGSTGPRVLKEAALAYMVLTDPCCRVVLEWEIELVLGGGWWERGGKS